MKIARIDLWHAAVPLPAPFHPSWIPGYRQTENRFDLVRLTTDSGVEGWSAAPAMGEERAGLGALLGPYLLGERADDIPTIRQRIREMAYLGWRVGWLEPACWDILGKAAGKPVYELLGGEPGRVRLYASTGDVRTVPERVDEVKARVDEGFEAVKLRVHADTLAEDLEHIRGTREAVGDEVVLGVDANQGWRVAVAADAPRWDLERAIAFCTEAEALGYAWVEEPLAADAYRDMARLCDEVGVAISGGELYNHGLPELQLMLDQGCLDVFQPDAVFSGGIGEVWELTRRVAAAGSRYSPHTWTNGIGFAINLHIFASSPFRESERLEYPYVEPGWIPAGRDGLLATPWHHDRGWLDLPTAPGLGFEIDRRALRRHARRFFTATPLRVAVSAVRTKGLAEARHLGKIRDARMAARSSELDRRFASGDDAVSLALEHLAALPGHAEGRAEGS